MTTNKENPPRNHIHIPAIKSGHVLIDGHPVCVKAGGVEIQGIGDPNKITTVTLTIFPETITIDGDLMTTPKKYRKKPVVIEAVQWTGDNPYAVRAFTGEHNTGVGTHMVFTTQSGRGELYVAANDKWLDIEVGEWIIRDSRGFYPCKPDIFEATYEVA